MKLSDEDSMPRGKHRGTKMKAVPATYLDWLDSQEWFRHSPDYGWQLIREYINENREAIQAEIPDD